MPFSTITNINAIGLSVAISMALLTLFLPRRYTILPFIAICFFLTVGQTISMFGLNITMLRCVLVFGWLRLILWKELTPLRLNVVDVIVLTWVVSRIIMHTLLVQTPFAAINRIGAAYDALGFYFLFRYLIRDLKDFERALAIMAVLAVPLAAAMFLESLSGRNLFFILGGVPEITFERNGIFRCQGPFAHPILAGTVGATLTPLFIGLWFKKGMYKGLSIIGLIAALTITITSASSGPWMACAYGVAAMMLWPIHAYMRHLRWAALILLVLLHMVMNAPIWSIIGRLSNLVGGTGWHRAALIHQAIYHFDEWWLVGTTYTAHWELGTLPNDPNMADITNQYILEGVNGGLLTMLLFISIIALCFRDIGRAITQVEKQSLAVKMILWAMGASLFSHVVSFISVSYFDQMIMLWYFLLASISSVTSHVLSMQGDGSTEGQYEERYLRQAM
jgi:hypothetical protein